MAKPPEPGTSAPEFTLPGLRLDGDTAERREYRLADAKGSPLVLAFYPGDDTLVCTRQLCSYNTDLDRFAELGAAVWGISGQDLDSHERFARKRGLGLPLLSDAGEAVARAYGITAPGIGLRRSVFLLDAEGTVRWRHVALAGLTFQRTDTLIRELAALVDAPAAPR
ncbi:peroxiredoxin [Kitasatospora cheerisanensis]|uniref:thioredoxin-dependent peroxiredoxin n=1 Tax=Kitasatospora cheerisanensis KCTC 2395 TaxID=1348663 RepID=A0A066YH12_9ACTN|nr:peroxiredoxin [Kitasatospora cheerisanensis]KDN80773.1 peroxiredoxin [Kitasatospora cheerisanensis KCTC 2395]